MTGNIPAGFNGFIWLIRWPLILPAVYLGWWLALVVGIGLHSAATAFCPEDRLDSGLCTAPWFGPVEAAIFVSCAALAASLVVALATVMAPARRLWVAWITFLAGGLFAGYLGFELSAVKEFIAAIFGGLGSVFAITRRLKRKPS